MRRLPVIDTPIGMGPEVSLIHHVLTVQIWLTCSQEILMAPATSHTSVLRGVLARPLQWPPPIYPPGRVCTAEGCKTRLSIYNKWVFCWLHEPLHV